MLTSLRNKLPLADVILAWVLTTIALVNIALYVFNGDTGSLLKAGMFLFLAMIHGIGMRIDALRKLLDERTRPTNIYVNTK